MKKLKLITTSLIGFCIVYSSYLISLGNHHEASHESTEHESSGGGQHMATDVVAAHALGGGKKSGMGGEAAMAGMASQNSDSSGGSGSGGSGSSSGDSSNPTTPTAPATPVGAEPAGAMYAAAPNTPVPTTNGTATPATADASTSSTDNPATDDKKNDPKKEDEIPTPPVDTPASQEEKIEHADQQEILEKLKQINIQDEHNHHIVNQASMELLFNNFVHLKDFLVQNFTKDKLLSLAIEFINQIYPNEHPKVISMKDSFPVASPEDQSSEESYQQPVEQDLGMNHEQPYMDHQMTQDMQDHNMPDYQDQSQQDYEQMMQNDHQPEENMADQSES